MIKPKEVMINATYSCPKCRWPNYFTEKQLSHPSFVFMCSYCGEILEIEKPWFIQNKKQNNIDSSLNNTKQHKSVLDPIIIKESIKILKSYGFNETDVISTIKKYDISGEVELVVQSVLEKIGKKE